MAARGDKLLGLREEFDIADAATPELDVVARDRDLAVALMGMHAPLHGVDVGDGREVEIFAPDEGRELAQELFARVDIAGNDARLDQGGALPVLAEAFVVGEACVGGERDLRRPRVRAKPQIRAEHITVAGMLLEETHQLARQPHEEGRRLDAWREPGLVGVVEDDDVDVARIIELVPAELAHGDDEIAAWRCRQRAGDLACCVRLTKQKPDSLIDGSLGSDTHGPEHRFRRPHAAEIGKANEKRDPPLVAAQGGHGLLRRFRRLGRRRKLRNRLFEMDVGIACRGSRRAAQDRAGRSPQDKARTPRRPRSGRVPSARLAEALPQAQALETRRAPWSNCR